MSTVWSLGLSVLLLAANGFFVAAEFALVASKRYRLEQAAESGGRAARAALAGSRELSLMLAGAQLGITVCSLGLGALAEPALEHLIDPLLSAVGLPPAPSHLIAFVVALVVVTFLHLVVGEMAPKSWAITHPERSALLLALPFRAFTRAVRPALSVLNTLANGVLRIFKVTPQDELAQVHGPDELRMLLEQSRAHGLLAPDQHALLTSMLTLDRTTVGSLMTPLDRLVAVPVDADAADIERRCRDSGRSRLAVVDLAGHAVGVVHVRDAVRATTAGRAATAGDLAAAPFVLDESVSVMGAGAAMRAERAQFALVRRDSGVVGFIALEDLLEQVIGEFDDETDVPVRTGRIMR